MHPPDPQSPNPPDRLNHTRTQSDQVYDEYADPFKMSRNVEMMKLEKVSDTVALVQIDGHVWRCYEETHENGEFWQTGMDWYSWDEHKTRPLHSGWRKTNERVMGALKICIRKFFNAKHSIEPDNFEQFQVKVLSVRGDFPADIFADFPQKFLVKDIVYCGNPTEFSFLDKIEGVVHFRMIWIERLTLPIDIFRHPTVCNAMVRQLGTHVEPNFRMDHQIGYQSVLQPDCFKNLVQTWINSDRPLLSFMVIWTRGMTLENLNLVAGNMPGARSNVDLNDTPHRRTVTCTLVPFGGTSDKWLLFEVSQNSASMQVVDHTKLPYLAQPSAPPSAPPSWRARVVQAFHRLACWQC